MDNGKRKTNKVAANTHRVTAENLTDEQCRAVADYLKSAGVKSDRVDNLLAGALDVCEPHRNHSRHELVRLQTAILNLREQHDRAVVSDYDVTMCVSGRLWADAAAINARREGSK